MEMSENLIRGIIYTEVDDNLGPNPMLWLPEDISEYIRLHVSVKTITILTAERGIIPDSLIIMPFPSLNLKGIIKYIKMRDKDHRGGAYITVITLLFNEINDVIFYKGIEYFESSFDYAARNIVRLIKYEATKSEILGELKNLEEVVTQTLKKLNYKENLQLKAFPESIISNKKIVNYQFKIIICGDPTVGKTSLILRYTDNAFNRNYLPTLGIHVTNKIINVEKSNIQLVIWDIAGQQKFATMRTAFYQGARGVLLVFDLTNRQSIESIKEWYEDIKRSLNENIYGFIIGNKNDLFNDREVSVEEANKLAYDLNLQYFETSALTGQNVHEAFENLAKYLYRLNF